MLRITPRMQLTIAGFCIRIYSYMQICVTVTVIILYKLMLATV